MQIQTYPQLRKSYWNGEGTSVCCQSQARAAASSPLTSLHNKAIEAFDLIKPASMNKE
jgi:hypothetical protein